MKLQIAKWGNSLAVRLPAECVRAAGLYEGDRVEAEITPTGNITLIAENNFDKKAFISRIRKLHKRMPVTQSVVEQMREDERY